MKKLILILLVFLESGFLFASDDSNFFIGNPDCLIYNPSPKSNERITWDGECKNSYANGNGVLRWYLNNKLGSEYNGNMVDGKPDGSGVYKYSVGSVYKGEFKAGKWHGKGKLTYLEGNVYEGIFENGVKHGYGIAKFKNGNQYEGMWDNNSPNGKGKYSYADGRVYEGEFKDWKQEGEGKLTNAKGIIYEGEFKNGMRNGKGKIITANGHIKEVIFENDHLKKDEPRYIKMPSILYPKNSINSNEEGTVLLKLLINQKGVPEDIIIQKSSGYARLDAAAIESAKTIEMVPAQNEFGKNESFWIVLPIKFKLTNECDAPLKNCGRAVNSKGIHVSP